MRMTPSSKKFQRFGTKFQKFHVVFTKLEPRKYLIYKAFMGLSTAKFQNSSFFQLPPAKTQFSRRAPLAQNARYHQAKLSCMFKLPLF
jgi:hypothetical protein